MGASTEAVVAILCMAVATYATRAAGLFLVGRMNLTPRAESFLAAIPGAVIVSIIAPSVLTQSPAEALAALATLGIAAKTRSLPLAMAVGVGTVWALRAIL